MNGQQSDLGKITFQWNLPDGSLHRVTLFDLSAPEAEAVAKACGWPGRVLVSA